MKRAHISNIKRISFGLIVCFFLFNCGLDIIEYYYPPVNNLKSNFQFSVSDADQLKILPTTSETFFSFLPNNLQNADSTTYKGTDIYYKIYNNVNTALSNAKTITDQLNIDSQYSMKSTEIMLNYGYKKIRKISSSGQVISEDCLIPKEAGDVKVDFFPGYNAESYLKIGTDIYTPIRYINPSDKYLNFEFANYSSLYDREVYTNADVDIDINFSQDNTTQEGTWYIVAFAVGTGVDFTFTEQHSAVLYLGCLPLFE